MRDRVGGDGVGVGRGGVRSERKRGSKNLARFWDASVMVSSMGLILKPCLHTFVIFAQVLEIMALVAMAWRSSV